MYVKEANVVTTRIVLSFRVIISSDGANLSREKKPLFSLVQRDEFLWLIEFDLFENLDVRKRGFGVFLLSEPDLYFVCEKTESDDTLEILDEES